MDNYRGKTQQTLTRAEFDVVQDLTGEQRRLAGRLFFKRPDCSYLEQKRIDKNIVKCYIMEERISTAHML